LIKENQFVKIKWMGNNRKYYESCNYIFSEFGNEFTVSISDLPKHSRVKIHVSCDNCNDLYELSNAQAVRAENHLCSKECKYVFGKERFECFICGAETFKNNTQIKKSTLGHHFCSNECVGKFNSLRFDETKITKNCLICDKEFRAKLSTIETQITCSRKCQGIWQSTYRIGENASNFRGGKIKKSCQVCGDIYYATRHSSLLSKFCSQKCKQIYWSENVITKESFKVAKYQGNLKARQTSKETLPEKLVREWLTENNISFKQECGFFHMYYADFYLHNTNIVIEVFGDYWHCNPKVYGEGLVTPTSSQLEQIKKDKIRIEKFNKHNFNVIVLWENEIYSNLETLMQKKIMTIYPRNDYTQSI